MLDSKLSHGTSSKFADVRTHQGKSLRVYNLKMDLFTKTELAEELGDELIWRRHPL